MAKEKRIDLKALASLLRRGYSLREIGKRLKVDQSTIWQKIYKYNIPRPRCPTCGGIVLNESTHAISSYKERR